MELDLNGTDSLSFTLNESDSLSFTLNETDSLGFTLSSDKGMSFNLSDTTDTLEFTITTPHVIDPNLYDGDYEVTPKTYSQTLDTEDKYLRSDIVINEIPYFETSNDQDGLTVYIANTLA